MPRIGSPDDGTHVRFDQIFGTEERTRLKEGAARVSDISKKGGNWKANISIPSWAGHKIGFLKKIVLRVVSFVRGQRHAPDLDYKLLSAYSYGFISQASASVTSRSATSHSGRTDLPPELDTPLGFRIATAMDLAGACKMQKGKNGQIGMKHGQGEVDDKVISQMDYLVNLNPHRLAYEFIVAKKRLPNGYIERVLIPHYMDRLTLEARIPEEEAGKIIAGHLESKGLDDDGDINFEALMDIRNSIDHQIKQKKRSVSSASPSAQKIPRGQKLTKELSGSVSQVTVAQVYEQGQASRQSVRDYLIQELRQKGASREKAREQVVAALETMGITHGSLLTAGQFQKLAGVLHLYDDHSPQQVVRDYLGLVSQLKVTASEPPSEECVNTLRGLGIKAEDEFIINDGQPETLVVIERPDLEPPAENITYTCNKDELWVIQKMVDLSYVIIFTKDMVNRLISFINRSKRVIAVHIASKLATAMVTGAVSGGIAGAIYLASAACAVPFLIGFDYGWGKVQEWWNSRKVKKYDSDGQPSLPGKRESLYDGLVHLTSEQALTDSFNAFTSLKSDLKDLKKLEGNASRSAADQIKFRRHQVMQQLRSSQLGDGFKNFDRLMVEAVTDLSEYENTFDKKFKDLWKPFASTTKGAPSEEHRLEIFNKAADRVMSEYTTRVVHENHHEWLKKLVSDKKESHRRSDRYLFGAFRKIKALPLKEVHASAAASTFNKLVRGTKDAFSHSAKVVGHFLFTNTTWNAVDFLKAGYRWFLHGILPNKIDLIPIPTAAVCVYWIVSFLGGKSLEMMNNRLNRLRVKDVMNSRKDDEEREVAFDAKVKPLDAEDWRALRREAKGALTEFSEILTNLHKEHLRLDKDLKKLQASPKDVLDLNDEALVERAVIILRRKYLEQRIQELLSGAVGTFYQEIVRGDWQQRQMLQDKEADLPLTSAAA